MVVDETSFSVALADQDARVVVAPDAAAKALWWPELEQLHEEEAAHKARSRCRYPSPTPRRWWTLTRGGHRRKSASTPWPKRSRQKPPPPPRPRPHGCASVLSTLYPRSVLMGIVRAYRASLQMALDEKAARKAEEKAAKEREKAEKKADKERRKVEDKTRREQEAAERARLAEEDRLRREEAKALARAVRSPSSQASSGAFSPPGRSSMDNPRPASPQAPPSPRPGDRLRAASGGSSSVERSNSAALTRPSNAIGRQSPYVSERTRK
jgi:hypothetical protein